MSRRGDLNLRPVAAATALQLFIQLIPSSPSLVISLALRRTGTSVKAFTLKQHPRYSVSRRFRIAGVMTTNSSGQILARTDVAPSGLLAQQHVTVKHSAWSEIHVGARGFEPPTCRRGDRSTAFYPTHPFLAQSCNIARVAPHRNECQSFHFKAAPKVLRVSSL